MNVEIILPPFFFNPDSQGFNEMLSSEIVVLAKQLNINIQVSNEYSNCIADIHIYPIQYREDVFSEWMIMSVNKINNGFIIVCGKSSSVEYKYILTKSKVDCVILGEIEITLKEIFQSYHINRTYLKNVLGIAYKENFEIIINNLRCSIDILDKLPIPSYEHLLNKQQYPICVMESSRSCHGKCNFCEGHLFRQFNPGSEYRAKSAKRVVEEIKFVIQTYGCRIFSFSDDNFMVDGNYGRERATEIANELVAQKIKIRYTIECRADDIDYENFLRLKKSGLCKVFIGIESGSQNVLDRYNKGTTIEDNKKAIQILQKLNISCHPGHILFDPFTTKDELIDTINFFEPYLNNLFSFNDGVDSRVLFFPNGCEIVKKYWPNQNEIFYQNIYNKGIDLIFNDQKITEIFKRFNSLLCNNYVYENYNLLQRRIYCLKKAINDVENGIYYD